MDLLYTQCGCCSLIIRVCSRLTTEGARSVFENSVELLSAHEMNPMKMRIDLADGSTTEDTEARVGP